MKKRIQVMLESDQYYQIEKKAKEIGLSLSSFVRLKLMERPLVVDGNKLVTLIKDANNDRRNNSL